MASSESEETARVAPFFQKPISLGEERGTLVRKRRAVLWIKEGAVFRRFPTDERPLRAMFATFPNGTDLQHLYVVIVCRDKIVFSHDTETGDSYRVGIEGVPKEVVPCGTKGVVLTFKKPGSEQLSISLLQGPEELPKSIVPSSVSAPLRTDDVLKFCDDSFAIVWSEATHTVKALSLKFLNHTPHASSVVNTDSLGKAAVYSFLREWPQASVGNVFSQTLLGLTHEGGALTLIASHDWEANCLYVFFGSDLGKVEDVRQVVPLAGFKQFPFAILLRDSNSTLDLCCLFFPQLTPLPVDAPKSLGAVTRLLPNPDCNWFDCMTSLNKRYRLSLLPMDHEALRLCFDIILNLWGPTLTIKWIMLFLGVVGTDMKVYDYVKLEAFAESFKLIRDELDPSMVSKFIVYLHMLCEELNLGCAHEEDIEMLASLISFFVAGWTDAWKTRYDVLNMPDDPLERSSELVQYAAGIPCYMVTPPCVYSVLSNMLNPAGDAVLPEFVAASGLYPTTVMVVELFSMLSLPGPVEDLQRFLIKNRFFETIDNFSAGIRACIMEVMGHLGMDPYILKATTEDPITSSKLTERFDSIIKGLFPQDLRFNEAVRLLQTESPQKCLFGIYHDSRTMAEHLLARTKKRWAKSLGDRALATSFGRAAINMNLKTPLMWEQLDAPTIDFSGECTETGVSITPAYSDLAAASEAAPWGVFAQGVAFGLTVHPKSPGVGSLWVITSAKLASASQELYAGFTYGMGLSGHLANLEDWQFYESLVSSNPRGTAAALLGVAASKQGSRDSKLTKVLSVHIRALLPAEAHDTQLVPPEVERAALIAIGLLYKGQGVRHLTEAMISELAWTPSNDGFMNSARSEHYEAHKLAVGLALGLIECGSTNKSGSDDLLKFVTGLHDSSVYSTEAVGGALVALLLTYVGSNNEIIASQIQLPRTRAAAEYSTPNTFFSRAFTFHMIMWDSVGSGKQWVSQNVPSELKMNAERGSTTKIDSLWYYYSLAGVLVAMAMRHTGSNNSEVIETILSFIEDEFYSNYTQCLRELGTGETNENEDPTVAKEVDYDTLQAAKHFSRLLSTLVLSLGAVAAGSGNLPVLKLCRKLWQVSPQFVASISNTIDFSIARDAGLDMTCISQTIGWLFLGGGQKSLKCDPMSVGFLSAFSFLDIFGGGAISSEEWQHLRFFWALCTENRCLYLKNDPAQDAQIEVELRSGEILEQHTPALLPPLQLIRCVRVNDERYVFKELFPKALNMALEKGLLLDVKVSGPFALASMLPSARRSIDWTKLEYTELRIDLETIAQFPESDSDVTEIKFLINFAESLPVESDTRLLSMRDIEKLKFLQETALV